MTSGVIHGTEGLTEFLPNDVGISGINIGGSIQQIGLVLEKQDLSEIDAPTDFVMTSGDTLDFVIYGGSVPYTKLATEFDTLNQINVDFPISITPGTDDGLFSIGASGVGDTILTIQDSINRRTAFRVVVEPEIRNIVGTIQSSISLSSSGVEEIFTYFAGGAEVGWTLSGTWSDSQQNVFFFIDPSVLGVGTGTLSASGAYNLSDSVSVTIT